jgi:hypothetical protein
MRRQASGANLGHTGRSCSPGQTASIQSEVKAATAAVARPKRADDFGEAMIRLAAGGEDSREARTDHHVIHIPPTDWLDGAVQRKASAENIR